MASCRWQLRWDDRRDRPQPTLGRREFGFTRPKTPTLSFPRKRESMARSFRARHDFGSHEDTKTRSNLFMPACLCANHFADRRDRPQPALGRREFGFTHGRSDIRRSRRRACCPNKKGRRFPSSPLICHPELVSPAVTDVPGSYFFLTRLN